MLDQTQMPKMYSNNMNSTTENIRNKSFNKGSTLNTEANNT